MRGILGRRRGANGRFCRKIPRFLSGARVRRGDSAHGGQGRALEAKKFLKFFRKGRKTQKIGVREGSGDGSGAPYIGCAGRFLGLETRPLAALLEVRFARASRLQASAVRHRSEISEIHSSYMGSYIWRAHLQAPSLALRRRLCLSDPQFSNLHLWLEATCLPYAG